MILRRRGCLVLLALLGAALAVSIYDARVRSPELHLRFRDELHAGLRDRDRHGPLAHAYPNLDVISVGNMPPGEFADRARRVAGWDRLAVIDPYGTGAELANEAAGFNPWLQLRLRCTDGFPQDFMNTVLVIDNGRVVATLLVEDCPVHGVLEREP